MRTVLRVVAGLALAAAVATGCSSSGSSSSATADTSAATTQPAKPVRILVTNDDGVGADGIDALVQGLSQVPGVEVTVVAPATNQSGKGSAVTGGTLTATQTTTKSGHPATAVEGTPADTIVWAIDQKGISFTPDLVISGINAGQNLGPATEASGTVGAARAAVQRGIPALAASQGQLTPPQDFPSGVAEVQAWLDTNLPAVRAGTLTTASVANLNVPTCTTGKVRGEVQVPVSSSMNGYTDPPNCASTATNPSDDIAGFLDGFATLSALSPTPAG